MVVSHNGWFIRENPKLNWMMTGGTPNDENLPADRTSYEQHQDFLASDHPARQLSKPAAQSYSALARAAKWMVKYGEIPGKSEIDYRHIQF